METLQLICFIILIAVFIKSVTIGSNFSFVQWIQELIINYKTKKQLKNRFKNAKILGYSIKKGGLNIKLNSPGGAVGSPANFEMDFPEFTHEEKFFPTVKPLDQKIAYPFISKYFRHTKREKEIFDNHINDTLTYAFNSHIENICFTCGKPKKSVGHGIIQKLCECPEVDLKFEYTSAPFEIDLEEDLIKNIVEFQQDIENHRNKLKNALIGDLKLVGLNKAAESIEKKGIPKTIYTSEKAFESMRLLFSSACNVICNKHLNGLENQVLFVWDDDFINVKQNY